VENSPHFKAKFHNISTAQIQQIQLQPSCWATSQTVYSRRSSLPGLHCPTLEQLARWHRAGWFAVDLSAPSITSVPAVLPRCSTVTVDRVTVTLLVVLAVAAATYVTIKITDWLTDKICDASSSSEMLSSEESHQDCCEYAAHHHDEYCSDLYEEHSASLMPAHSDSQSFSLSPPANITHIITTLLVTHNFLTFTTAHVKHIITSCFCTTATQWQMDKYWTHRLYAITYASTLQTKTTNYS